MIKDALLGLAVGDALGVPHEFKPREEFETKPVRDMDGFGTYNLPPGTWSDDTSLSLCLAEALTFGFDLDVISANFQKWFKSNYWTARGEVFDIGITTRESIDRLSRGIKPDLAGGFDENENGNGSLMRILPLLFYMKDFPISERFRLTKLVSSITHGHVRSVIACFYYLEFARLLLDKQDKRLVYSKLRTQIPAFLHSVNISSSEIKQFDGLLTEDIGNRSQSGISSTGYVLHSLEASIWCLLTTDCYEDAVLRAVNLGNDTDTTAAITGGLAGILYGAGGIPASWLNMLARRADIEELAMRLAQRLG